MLAVLTHGVAIGNVMGSAVGTADDFLATFNSTLDASLHVEGHFGDIGDPRLPGVVQGGQCSGRWTRVP
jgi:hypothetical protein